MNLNVVSAITRKDVIDAIRHRYLLTALVTPLLVALLFRVLLPGVNDNKLLTIVVHDAGGSGLVTELRKTPQISVVPADSADATGREVERIKAIGGLVVPAGFDADLAANKQPELTVYVNNQKTIFEQAAFRRLLDQLVRSFAKQPEPARLVWVDVDKAANAQALGATSLNQMLLPLLLILTFGMTGAFVVPLLIVEEKEKRTLDFLLSSPASLNEIIAGKALTGVVYTVLIAGLLLGINRDSIQNWPLTSLTILVGLLFVVGVGLVIGSVLKNTMQVNTWAGLILILLLAPSMPLVGLSGWFDKSMRIIPTYYLSEALKLSIAGIISSQLWIYLAVLVVCTVVVFFAAAWALHRRN
ncbi:MAG TPA: ABC transporter permease [Pyrinomonadaceae bacterium]|nr:ABC transporter permease [Pyrinomonadaceae bacterium]